MSDLLSFLQNPTSNSTIVIVAVLVALPQIPAILKLVKTFWSPIDHGKEKEDSKLPLMEEYLSMMSKLNGTNEKLLENHFKHEIPEMMKDIKEIKNIMYEMRDNHGNRLTRLETLIEK